MVGTKSKLDKKNLKATLASKKINKLCWWLWRQFIGQATPLQISPATCNMAA